MYLWLDHATNSIASTVASTIRMGSKISMMAIYARDASDAKRDYSPVVGWFFGGRPK
ncbi:hypothetical protein CP97_14795 [Aurantiacibacter atlanticus]|uniref:Uncharacterized protein n=1 Tax=Aurantiacibacter atlanticus TaxID=1648404 RepID=A0A161I493_9SPHN|nr:hypothetical protein CP97_14795 [Aurantiacibacter atlanticus]